MNWLEIAVAADEEAVEAVAEVLRAHGQGVAIDEPFVQPRIDESPQRDPSRRATVKTYIPDDSAAPQIQREIDESLWHIGQLRQVEPISVRRVAEEDWANTWKAYFPVVPIGERTVVVPAWRRHRRREGEILIRLDPGLAFGTGMHPTTRLCLAIAEQIIQPGMDVLDVGTGSGILAIAAARLGARRVIAVDTDPVAVSAARENVRLNHLSRVIKVEEGGPERLVDGGVASPTAAGVTRPSLAHGQAPRFDVVLANITARVNAALAPVHAALLAPGGWLIASGILEDSEILVTDALRAAGVDPVDIRYDGDWVGVVGRRRTATDVSRGAR